jgi:glucose-6-phosphate-specific signal transduction histidine kinase
VFYYPYFVGIILVVIDAMVLVVFNRYYPYFVVMVLVVVNIVVAIIGESYARVKARQSLQSDECAMTPSEILHGELTPLWYQLSRGMAQRIRCMCICVCVCVCMRVCGGV